MDADAAAARMANIDDVKSPFYVKGRERYLLPPARLYERRFRSAKTQKHIRVGTRWIKSVNQVEKLIVNVGSSRRRDPTKEENT